MPRTTNRIKATNSKGKSFIRKREERRRERGRRRSRRGGREEGRHPVNGNGKRQSLYRHSSNCPQFLWDHVSWQSFVLSLTCPNFSISSLLVVKKRLIPKRDMPDPCPHETGTPTPRNLLLLTPANPEIGTRSSCSTPTDCVLHIIGVLYGATITNLLNSQWTAAKQIAWQAKKWTNVEFLPILEKQFRASVIWLWTWNTRFIKRILFVKCPSNYEFLKKKETPNETQKNFSVVFERFSSLGIQIIM